MKARLNNAMRSDMLVALVAHGFDARCDALIEEGTTLRNKAIERTLTKEQVAAILTLEPFMSKNKNLNYGGGVTVNCGGLSMNPGAAMLIDSCNCYGPIGIAIPLPRSFGLPRLDLDGDDDLAKRIVDWAERVEAYKSERRTTVEQVRAALAAINTITVLESAWPDAMPVLQPIIEEHIGRPAPSLPAVVIGELNAALKLPPAENDTLELTDAVAA